MKTFHELTSELIEDHARKGGSSVSLIGEDLPPAGYIVAVDSGPHFEDLEAMSRGGKAIEEYAASQARLLETSKYFLGSYKFQDSEEVAVDISLVCADLETALTVAKARREESVWDIQRWEPVFTPGI